MSNNYKTEECDNMDVIVAKAQKIINAAMKESMRISMMF